MSRRKVIHNTFEKGLHRVVKTSAAPGTYEPLSNEELMKIPLPQRVRAFHSACEHNIDRYPQAISDIYPKVYNNIGSFHSPRLLAGTLLAFGPELLQRSRELKVPPPPETIDTIIWLPYLCTHKVPTYFIKKDFAQAVLHTDIHIDDWTALHLPFECGALILERGALTSPHYGDLMFVLWGRSGAKYLNSLTALNVKFEINGNIEDVVGEGTSHLGHLGIFSDGTTFNGDFMNREDRENKVIDSHEIFEHESFTVDGDKELAIKVRLLCYGTLLAMMARPELIQHGYRANVVKREDRRQEFWTPNVVGAKYKFQREGPAGTHASPRMHWRRGHFRKQPCGPKGVDRKVIWLEPCLIAAKPEEKAK